MTNEEYKEIENLIKFSINKFRIKNNVLNYNDMYDYALLRIIRRYKEYDETKAKLSTFICNLCDYYCYNFLRENKIKLDYKNESNLQFLELKDDNEDYEFNDYEKYGEENKDLQNIENESELLFIFNILKQNNEKLYKDLINIKEKIDNSIKLSQNDKHILRNINIFLKKYI